MDNAPKSGAAWQTTPVAPRHVRVPEFLGTGTVSIRVPYQPVPVRSGTGPVLMGGTGICTSTYGYRTSRYGSVPNLVRERPFQRKMAFWYGVATGHRTDLVRDCTKGYGNPHLGGTGARTLRYGYRTSTVQARTVGTGRYGCCIWHVRGGTNGEGGLVLGLGHMQPIHMHDVEAHFSLYITK